MGPRDREKSCAHGAAGLYGVKFVSEQLIRFLELREEDYDTDDIWVQIKRAG